MLSVFNRIYADYLMPSRIVEYEALITTALQNNYRHVTIPEFYKMVTNNALNDSGKLFIHRHDIDTDFKTAELFFEVEKKLNVKTSYYFRINTWHVELIKRIAGYGSEVGYHYEELAQYCKDNNVSGTEIKKHYNTIRLAFKANLKQLELKTGLKIKTIASHGDFINRKILIANHDFITDDLMNETGIDFECYDKKLLSNYGTILSDAMHPVYYKPQNPFDCIKRGDRIIYLLTHPRHWHVARIENTTDNIKRLIEGIKYKG